MRVALARPLGCAPTPVGRPGGFATIALPCVRFRRTGTGPPALTRRVTSGSPLGPASAGGLSRGDFRFDARPRGVSVCRVSGLLGGSFLAELQSPSGPSDNLARARLGFGRGGRSARGRETPWRRWSVPRELLEHLCHDRIEWSSPGWRTRSVRRAEACLEGSPEACCSSTRVPSTCCRACSIAGEADRRDRQRARDFGVVSASPDGSRRHRERPQAQSQHR
jgi:hypothetical protein